MGLFKKKKKKKIYSASIAAVKVFDKDALPDAKRRLVLEKIKKNLDAVDYVKSYANSGAAQLFEYYLSGKYRTGDRLPTATINSLGVSDEAIKAVIDDIEGTPVTVLSCTFDVPDDGNWVTYQLQEMIGYRADSQTVVVNDCCYTLADYEYNETTDLFDAILKALPGVVENVGQSTVVSVLAHDDEYDTETTVITNYRNLSQIVDEDIVTLYQEETVVSTESVLVLKDTVSPSVTYTNISETPLSDEGADLTYHCPAYKDDTGYYFCEYALPFIGLTKYWFYDYTTKIYPTLNPNILTSQEIETYPITLFRNGVFSVDEYDIGSKWIRSGNRNELVYRPATLTKTRYEETKRIFRSIGLDVDDVIENIEKNKDIDQLQDGFMTIGVAPANKHPIVSKILYETFDYFYNKLPPLNITTKSRYIYSIREGPYNTHFPWVPVLPIITKEVIGTPDTYTHSIKIVPTKFYRPEVKSITKRTDPLTGVTHSYVVFTRFRYYEVTGGVRTVPYDVLFPVYEEDGKFWIDYVYYTKVRNEEGEVVREIRHEIKLEVRFIGDTHCRVYFYDIHNLKSIVCKKQVNKDEVRTIIIGQLPLVRRVSFFEFRVTNEYQNPWTTYISRGGRGATVTLPFNDPDFILPIPVKAMANLNYLEQVSALSMSMYMMFYAARYDKITYYKSTGFGKFLGGVAIVVGIALSVISFGSSLNLSAAGAALTLATVLTALEPLLIGLALTIALKITSKVINDPTLKAAVTIALSVTAMYVGGGFDNFSFDFSTLSSLANMPIEAMNIYTKAKLDNIADKMKSLTGSSEAFQTAYNALTEKYESLLKSFNTGITTAQLTSMNQSEVANMEASLMSPSMLRYMLIEGYKDFDVIYKSSIDVFFAQQNNIGVLEL